MVFLGGGGLFLMSEVPLYYQHGRRVGPRGTGYFTDIDLDYPIGGLRTFRDPHGIIAQRPTNRELYYNQHGLIPCFHPPHRGVV